MKEDLVRLRHERSKHDYPELNLEDSEFVELRIARTKVGLIFIILGAIVSVVALLVIMSAALSLTAQVNKRDGWPFLMALIGILCVVVVLIGLVTTYVYKRNVLFITNQRVIQMRQDSLFARSTNIIELSRIEDVSFKQTNPVQYFFKYGTIRLSTVGDETTYTFKFIDTPDDEIEAITRLVHDSKELGGQSSAGSN